MVEELFIGEQTGHDIYHLFRVKRLALYIADKEGGDKQLVSLIAMLHEVEDQKLGLLSKERARRYLQEQGYEEEFIEKVLKNALNISYSKGNWELLDWEGKIVQDADRLDALGAIGIARAFATSAKLGKPLYDPRAPLDKDVSAIHHFYNKLFKLPKLMNTKTGKKLAQKRVRYMKSYLQRFLKEWNLEDLE
ncbi:MAG: phosphohydrolase [Candidatus Micrarchaeota archaeon]|nr:phosphohydrolase [Candidatus Micrarchaeota archaeon]